MESNTSNNLLTKILSTLSKDELSEILRLAENSNIENDGTLLNTNTVSNNKKDTHQTLNSSETPNNTKPNLSFIANASAETVTFPGANEVQIITPSQQQEPLSSIANLQLEDEEGRSFRVVGDQEAIILEAFGYTRNDMVSFPSLKEYKNDMKSFNRAWLKTLNIEVERFIVPEYNSCIKLCERNNKSFCYRFECSHFPLEILKFIPFGLKTDYGLKNTEFEKIIVNNWWQWATCQVNSNSTQKSLYGFKCLEFGLMVAAYRIAWVATEGLEEMEWVHFCPMSISYLVGSFSSKFPKLQEKYTALQTLIKRLNKELTNDEATDSLTMADHEDITGYKQSGILSETFEAHFKTKLSNRLAILKSSNNKNDENSDPEQSSNSKEAQPLTSTPNATKTKVKKRKLMKDGTKTIPKRFHKEDTLIKEFVQLDSSIQAAQNAPIIISPETPNNSQISTKDVHPNSMIEDSLNDSTSDVSSKGSPTENSTQESITEKSKKPIAEELTITDSKQTKENSLNDSTSDVSSTLGSPTENSTQESLTEKSKKPIDEKLTITDSKKIKEKLTTDIKEVKENSIHLDSSLQLREYIKEIRSILITLNINQRNKRKIESQLNKASMKTIKDEKEDESFFIEIKNNLEQTITPLLVEKLKANQNDKKKPSQQSSSNSKTRKARSTK